MLRKQENKNLCEEILREVAAHHKIDIAELSVMPDHIHTLVGIPPTMSVSKALHLLKGASAHELFKERIPPVTAYFVRYRPVEFFL